MLERDVEKKSIIVQDDQFEHIVIFGFEFSFEYFVLERFLKDVWSSCSLQLINWNKHWINIYSADN